MVALGRAESCLGGGEQVARFIQQLLAIELAIGVAGQGITLDDAEKVMLLFNVTGTSAGSDNPTQIIDRLRRGSR